MTDGTTVLNGFKLNADGSIIKYGANPKPTDDLALVTGKWLKGYLPLSGGTMTGSIRFPTNSRYRSLVADRTLLNGFQLLLLGTFLFNKETLQVK